MTGAVVAVPFLAAVLLAVVPERAGAWVGLGATLLALALAGMLALAGQASALGTVLALLAAFVAATTAWSAVHAPGPAGRAEARARRIEGMLFQAILGGALLATLADSLALGWIGLEVGVIAVAAAAALPRTRSGVAAGWRRLLAGSAALGAALIGVAVLGLAVGAALPSGPATVGWSDLAQAAPTMRPALLDLAFPFLAVGWAALAALAPLQSWFTASDAEGGSATTGVLPVLLTNAALANLLHLRGIMAACPGTLPPGPVLVALGVTSVLASALLMTRRQGTRPFAAVSTVGQNGIAALAFGLGGGAAFAGLLHLVLHTLTKSALLQGLGGAGAPRSGLWRVDRRGAALVLAAGLGVAGLPPAGVFVSEFLVLAEATRQAPLVAALLAAGVVVAAVAVLAWLRRLVLGPATPDAGTASPATTRPAALLGPWAALALAAVLGVAMPEPILTLLRAAAR